MFSIKTVFLHLLCISFTYTVYSGRLKEEAANSSASEILDCTNAPEPSSCSHQGVDSNITKVHGWKQGNPSLKRRHKNDIVEVCANGLKKIDSDLKQPALICSKNDFTPTSSDEDTKSPIQVFIKIQGEQIRVEAGSSLTIECRVNATSKSADMEFRLRWMRSVVGSSGKNQSISNTGVIPETDSNSGVFSVNSSSRLSTEFSEGKLDLKLDNFQATDVGSYFCQAISYKPMQSKNFTIISEAQIYLDLFLPQEQDQHSISAENLSDLLPSLKIVPNYVDAAPGSTVQLACLTSAQDPDPDPTRLEWSFEPVYDRRDLLTQPPSVAERLPNNVTLLGNILVIWSMSSEHTGFYKCKFRLHELNLGVEASSEVSLREGVDSAPMVFVTPELLRLPVNGTASVQCEATGYPPPVLTWYRLFESGGTPAGMSMTNLKHELNLRIIQVNYPDSLLYCRLSKCSSAWPSHNLTSFSLIRLSRAETHHQGHYVCRADNKHGSNQASSILDVELREPPKISVKPSYQVIELVASPETNQKRANATFRCSLEAAQPQARLRWLRTNYAGGWSVATRASSRSGAESATNLLPAQEDSFDAYDLTRTSSATSSVSTRLSDGARSLILDISTSSPEDEGDYVCLAENDWGRASALAHLSVRWPSSVRIVQVSPLIGQLNSSFHLECLASGHPGPLELEWSRTDRGVFFSLISRVGPGQERAILKFDRVSADESGEYTCTARTYSGETLRDTIMLLVENESKRNLSSSSSSTTRLLNRELYPRLLVRPSKVSTQLGSNVSLDCLAVSGLQPTLVEWLAPASSGITTIINSDALASNGTTSQFGSRLRISNVSRQHEGVYQCRGRNRLGAELAPALLEILDIPADSKQTISLNSSSSLLDNGLSVSKSKIARIGSNIELKCQVNGLAASAEQPATSWSRDGLELPSDSVQLGHNLWIRNVSERDSGMYVCLARALEPNRLHQARVRLEVVRAGSQAANEFRARIVASKSQVNVGDSLTLECLIEAASSSLTDHLERTVLWTAERIGGGQEQFQDNVYVQGNLLIIYELRPENSANYRCHYDEFSQSVTYQLQLLQSGQELIVSSGSSSNPAINLSTHANNIVQIPLDARLELDCPAYPAAGNASSIGNIKLSSEVFWFRGGERMKQQFPIGTRLILDSIKVHQADLYQCQVVSSSTPHHFVIVQVIVPTVRFLQRPVSFVSLPAIAGADHQLELELTFLPERESGLILFSGSNHWNRLGGDYISLGLVKGHIEFRFELGDGPTLLRSSQALQINQWHRLLIERNRHRATMWIDRQQPVSNSSTGKFFNLNLESVLYVGGHPNFLNGATSSNKSTTIRPIAQSGKSVVRFYGYSRGFQGCIGLLRVGEQQVSVFARNRSVAIGIKDCEDKPDCNKQRMAACGAAGVCQTSSSGGGREALGNENNSHKKQKQPMLVEPRCICYPGFSGEHCDRFNIAPLPPIAQISSTSSSPSSSSSSRAENILSNASVDSESKQTSSSNLTNKLLPSPTPASSCETLFPCSVNGTLKCHSVSSSSFKCHCLLGFMGETCNVSAQFSSETSVWFNQQAYLQLRLKLNRQVVLAGDAADHQDAALVASKQQTLAALVNSMSENQNISFRLRTNSSYGLIFYTGQTYSILEDGAPLELAAQSQTSKSMVANLLARLFSTVTDYLAVALVDGHVELSFELGSGVAIIRSSERVNDSREHQIRVIRNGRHAKLLIDDTQRHEGSSPGKLSALNGPADVYLGGLPHLAELTHNMYVSGFVGCVSSLEINSAGPLNLIKGDQFCQVRAARNLAPCSESAQVSASNLLPVTVLGSPSESSTDLNLVLSQPSTTIQTTNLLPSYTPYKPQTPQSPEADDSDDLKR